MALWRKGKIFAIPGFKKPGDEIIMTDKGALTFVEVVFLLKKKFENEERIYPPSEGYRGGQMLKDFIDEAIPLATDMDIIQKLYDERFKGSSIKSQKKES